MITRNTFEMLLCSEKKANKKVSSFQVCSRVLNFIVIGHYTINSPEIFQVFTNFSDNLTIIIRNFLPFFVLSSK